MTHRDGRVVASAAFTALAVACAARTPWARAHEVPAQPAARRVDIAVTSHGFEPRRVQVERGETVTFVFTRRVERTCVDRVVLSLDADHRLERDLPVGAPVTATVVFDAAGELGFSCPMNMAGGTIEVR